MTDTAINHEVGWRIRLWRYRSGLSQAALAQKLGISRSQVGKYEQGRQALTVLLLTKMASVLGVRLIDLLTVVPRGVTPPARKSKKVEVPKDDFTFTFS